jgi:hypothetical protein
MGYRGTEERHDTVAHHLIDGPLIEVNRFHHLLDHRIEKPSRFLGITGRDQLHGPLQVGE